MYLMLRFSEIVRRGMALRGVTHQELADRLGVSRQCVSITLSRPSMSEKSYRRMMRALDLDVREDILLGWESSDE